MKSENVSLCLRLISWPSLWSQPAVSASFFFFFASVLSPSSLSVILPLLYLWVSLYSRREFTEYRLIKVTLHAQSARLSTGVKPLKNEDGMQTLKRLKIDAICVFPGGWVKGRQQRSWSRGTYWNVRRCSSQTEKRVKCKSLLCVTGAFLLLLLPARNDQEEQEEKREIKRHLSRKVRQESLIRGHVGGHVDVFISSASG